MTAWQIGWIKTLVTEHRKEHDWAGDEDPAATEEMLREASAVADELLTTHKECASCRIADALRGGELCQECQWAENTASKPDPSIPF